MLGYGRVVRYFWLLVVPLFIFAQFALLRDKSTEVSVKHEATLVLTCRLLQETWHGDPVYVLENKSDELLAHVTVMSWSEQYLPILWVGSGNGPRTPELKLSVDPPVNLPAHQTIWFAGPRSETSIPPRHFKIDWLKNGYGETEVVQVQGFHPKNQSE